MNQRAAFILLSQTLAITSICQSVFVFCLPAQATSDSTTSGASSSITTDKPRSEVTTEESPQPASSAKTDPPSEADSDEIKRVTYLDRDLKHIHGIHIFSENSLFMSTGKILFTPNQDIQVKTKVEQILIGAGAVVLVEVYDGVTVVYNFHDKLGNNVCLNLADKSYQILPGSMLTVSQDSHDSFELPNPEHLPTRSVHRTVLGKNMILHTAEFSLMRSLVTLAPFRKARAEKSAADKQLMAKLYKTAVILNTLSTKRWTFDISDR